MKIKEHRKESADTLTLCRATYTFYLLSKLNSDITKTPIECKT